MPSPFPGMDPYLEHPEFFPDLHDTMIILLKEVIQARLPEPYYATSNSRAWIEVSNRFIEPDVEVLRPRPESQPKMKANGLVALAPPTVRGRSVLVHVPHDERREIFLDIHTQQGHDDRLITSIEILSPTNKTPGEHGRELYVRKQQEILGGKVHLVEIDLLRGGVHSTVVPRHRIEQTSGPFDYHVSVHFFDHLEDHLVYPIRLEEMLPEIGIPLMPDDSPVIVDLQAILDRAYAIGGYPRRIRYQEKTPVPPLTTEQAAWATQLLRDKGLLAPP